MVTQGAHVRADQIYVIHIMYGIRPVGSSDVSLATVGPYEGKDGEVEEEAGHPCQDKGPAAPVLTW